MRLVLEVAALRLSKLLGISFNDTIDIAIVQSQEEFDALAGGKIPEWGAGAQYRQEISSSLRQPMMNRYPGNTADLLQHEFAHIALSRHVKTARMPRFIDEGFASWFAGEWAFAQVSTIASAQITKSILPLRDIDDVNRFHQGEANLAYAQSYLVVNFIFTRYGELAFLDLLDAFASGQNMSEAFHSTFGVSFWRFEADYRKFLSDNYTLFAILSDMTGLWIFLALIVVFGWIIIRKRKKTRSIAGKRKRNTKAPTSTIPDRTMSHGKTLKKIQHVFEYLFVRAFHLLVKLTPDKLRVSFAGLLADIARLFTARRVKVARRNLNLVFSESTPAEVQPIIRAVYRNIARNAFDVADAKAALERIKVPPQAQSQLSTVRNILAAKRPVVFATGHIGNWEILGQYIGIEFDECRFVAQEQSNKLVDRYINKLRIARMKNNTIIHSHAAARELPRALKQGAPILLVADQDAGKEGIVVDFMGTPASYHRGIASFAYHYNAPLVVVFLIRNGDD